MHELPVVEELIRIVTAEAKAKNIEHVNSISLVTGELSSIMDEAVQMYFELLAEDTLCEGAKLHFEFVPAMLRCRVCTHEFPHKRSFDCPQCGGETVLIKGTGQEFYIKSFDGD